jgi:hypothetical protein
MFQPEKWTFLIAANLIKSVANQKVSKFDKKFPSLIKNAM